MSRQTGLLIVLGVVAAAAIGFNIWRYWHGAAASAPQVLGVCLACKQELPAGAQRPTTPPPWRCTRCGQTAVYPWMFCLDCGYRFVSPPVRDPAGGPPRMQQPPRCPVCPNGGHVEAWDAGFAAEMGETRNGDRDLPPLPAAAQTH